MKLNKKKIKYFIADEKKAVREYHKYGLHGLAYDEKRHMKYLRKKYKLLGKK
jgi:hypothetical protein